MAAQLKAFGLGSPAKLGALPKGAPFAASPAAAPSSAPAQLRRELKGAALSSRKSVIGSGAEPSRPAASHVPKALPTPGTHHSVHDAVDDFLHGSQACQESMANLDGEGRQRKRAALCRLHDITAGARFIV